MNFSFGFPYALSAIGAFTLLALFKVTCVLLVALAVTALMRRASAGARHLVWLVALIAALVVPSLSAWAPVPVRVLPAVTQPVVPTATAGPAITRAPVTAPEGGASSSAPVPSPIWSQPLGIGVMSLALWLLIAMALLGRLALGAWTVQRIVARGRALEQADWQRPLCEIADRLGLEDAPRLVQSDLIKMPFATGCLNAVIVLPLESASWNAERRCAVLIHELAHVKRRDLAGHLVSRIACALYWFHPLVWSAARQLRAESERACDDLALVLGTRASEYAEHLLDIVKDVHDERMPAVALAMAKPSEFEGRMLAILDPRRRRRGPGRIQAAWLVGTLTALALVVGALSPARRATATPTGSVSRASIQDKSAEPNPVDDSQLAAAPAASKPARSTQPLQPAQPKDQSAQPKEKDDEATQDANDAQRVQVLAKSLRSDPDAEVRRVAAWGLANHADADVAVQALVDAVAKEQDVDVREMATWALAESHSAAAATALESAMRRDKSAKVRRTAAWAAGSVGSKTSVESLAALLADTDPDLREVAAWSIGNCSPDHAPPALIHALGDSNRDVRLSAAWALHVIGDAGAAPELEAAFHREKDPEVQRGLIRALGAMGDQAVATLTRLVESPDKEIRAVAVTALAGGNAGGPWPWPRPEPRPYP